MALTRDLVLQIRAVNRAKGALASVRSEIEKIHMAVQALNTGQPISGKAFEQAGNSADKAKNKIKEMDRAVSKHVNTHKSLSGAITKTTTYFDKQGKSIDSLSKSFTTLKTQTAEVGKQVGILRGFMDGLTNSTRVSAEGFGKMIANNVTWLAGFALISATIGSVIKLFGDLADRQNQFVKVSRLLATAIDDENQRAIANVVSYQVMTKEMAKSGRTAEEVAEAQYQLLSAGLSLTQVNEGLGPALNLIDAAMDDVTQTTKLLAGIMNNYGETMYKTADGQVVFANSTRAVTEGLSANVTEGEKMAAVSNLLAVAFDKHQAEVNELRDGLKFSIPAARAAGIGLDELTATLVTLEDHMIKSGRAGRSLRIMLAQIAKNPEAMKKAFKTVFDPTEVDPLISFLKRAGAEFDKIPSKAEKLALAYELFTSRGADAFLQVTAEVTKLDLSMDELREKGKQVDEVMANIVRSSPEKQFKRLWESIVNVVDAIGGGGLVKLTAQFAGALADMTQGAADGINFLTRLAMAIREHGKQSAEAAKGGEGFKNTLTQIFSKKWEAPEKDPLVEALFGENWDAGVGVIKNWMNSVLVVKDAEAAATAEIENNIKAMQGSVLVAEDAYKQNVKLAESTEFISNMFASLQIGDQLSSGVLNAADAVRKLNEQFAVSKDEATFTKIDEDIVVFTTGISAAEDKLKFFNDFLKDTGSAALDGFKRATEEVAKFNQELKNIAAQTDKINLEIAEFGDKGAKNIMSLANAMGFGSSSANGLLDKSKSLADQIKKLEKDYDKAFYAGEKQEKLIEINDKIVKLKKEESLAQEKATQSIQIVQPLLEQQLKSYQRSASMQSKFASVQHTIATDESKRTSEREQAANAEEAYLEKRIKAIEEAAKIEKQLAEYRWKQGIIGEEDYQRQTIALYNDAASKIEGINSQISRSQQLRLSLQVNKEEEAKKKLLEAQTALERYNGLLKDIAKAVKDAKVDEFASSLATAFVNAYEPIKKVHEEITDTADSLDRLTSKTHIIKIRKEILTTSEDQARGGIAGYAAITNVTAGEGFVPPSIAKHNLPTLQAINQGSVMPANFPIQRFHGPPGIDNIQTSLPAGSFVISKRGMDALERSSSNARDAVQRRNFQLGGVVGGGTLGDLTTQDQAQQRTSRFDLVLNVGGDERRFPLMGSKATIDELANELEKQNLLRL